MLLQHGHHTPGGAAQASRLENNHQRQISFTFNYQRYLTSLQPTSTDIQHTKQTIFRRLINVDSQGVAEAATQPLHFTNNNTPNMHFSNLSRPEGGQGEIPSSSIYLRSISTYSRALPSVTEGFQSFKKYSAQAIKPSNWISRPVIIIFEWRHRRVPFWGFSSKENSTCGTSSHLGYLWLQKYSRVCFPQSSIFCPVAAYVW